MEPTDNVSRKRAELRHHPPGHCGRDIALFALAWALSERYKKGREIDDLNEAITLHRAALELRPVGNDERAWSLSNVAYCLSKRYDKLGAVDDLEEAITLGREALELCSPGHPGRGISCYSLAHFLRKRFQKQANSRDLDEEIQLYCAALEVYPHGHNQRPSSLHNLARCFSDRYKIESAMLGHATAVLRPSGHPDRGETDLDEAIACEQEALQLLTSGDPYYEEYRRCLIAYLQMKTRSQVTMLPSNSSPAANFDIKQVIRDVAFEKLKAIPPRLLHTVTGFLCNRDAQISHFMRSQEYDQLLSSCATCDPSQQMKLIRAEVSKYFRFVTLSHRWGEGEPLLRDIEDKNVYSMSAKDGLGKLQAFCAVACEQGYLWAWSDTCCIDKGSSAELQEAIGSMFAWYRRSALAIVYLSDVPNTGSFGSSEWFRRGWTLQELLAPRRILFYTRNWSLYKNLASSNHKADAAVLEELEGATGIESRFLTNFSPGMNDARSRLQWASLRRTTRPEDIAYSLFGVFNIHLPILYGESAENALGRLLVEVIGQSGDISILDWTGRASPFNSCFPAHITSYQKPPLSPLQLDAEEDTTTRLPSRTREESVSLSSTALQMLYRSLANSPLPRFLSRRLTLSCIAYAVTAVRRRRSGRSYGYKIRASGLRPLEATLPSELEDEVVSQSTLLLVRPWHSKLLDPPTELIYGTPEEQLLLTLGRPFTALLLIELPHNEYKRIASSTPIIAQPLDSTSILQSDVRTLEIV
ncbi:hypothetical protein BKA82DRAFT_2435625 [Pisolithus tinctorius]|nr:hypothetical protein BKA82DRAFT_2435625 [Pisolithus tinctorius]